MHVAFTNFRPVNDTECELDTSTPRTQLVNSLGAHFAQRHTHIVVLKTGGNNIPITTSVRINERYNRCATQVLYFLFGKFNMGRWFPLGIQYVHTD